MGSWFNIVAGITQCSNLISTTSTPVLKKRPTFELLWWWIIIWHVPILLKATSASLTTTTNNHACANRDSCHWPKKKPQGAYSKKKHGICFFILQLRLASQAIPYRSFTGRPRWSCVNIISAGLVVQRLDSAIHRLNLYPVDSAISSPNTYPLDSDLPSG